MNKKTWHLEKKQQFSSFFFILIISVLFYLSTLETQGNKFLYYLALFFTAMFIYGLIMNAHERITIDVLNKRIIFSYINRFSSKLKNIPFELIDYIYIYERENSEGSPSYDLYVELKSGKSMCVVNYDYSKQNVIELGNKLSHEIGCDFRFDKNMRGYFFNYKMVASAAFFSLLSYIVWYRLTTGQICTAMWFGTAPIVIIGLVFVSSLNLLRRYWS